MQVGNNNEVLKENANFVWTGSLWVPMSANASGQLNVVLPTVEAVESRVHGYINSAWQNNPIIWGISDTLNERVDDSSTPAGTHQIYTTTVPEGEIHRFTYISYYLASTTINNIVLIFWTNGTSLPFYSTTTLLNGIWVSQVADISLKEDDKISLYCQNCTAGDAMSLVVLGYKMDIDI